MPSDRRKSCDACEMLRGDRLYIAVALTVLLFSAFTGYLVWELF